MQTQSSTSPELFDTSTIKVSASAPWLPRPLRRRLERERCLQIGVRFSKAERKVMHKPKMIPPSQWSERHRMLTMSSLPGPWRNEATPYLVGIMDAAAFPSVRTTILCKAPQVGGSEIGHNFVGWCADLDPGPVLYVFPDELTARENSRDRIAPMFKSSPRLRAHLSTVQDDTATLRINLKHMPIYLAWATSPARLGNKPIRIVVFDEVDKYPETSGKREGDPISLGEKRTNTYPDNHRIWKISTPTTPEGNIWQALTKEAQALFDYWVYCPRCGADQLMNFDQIQFFGERDPEKIEADRSARYECPHCHEHWDDEQRNQAVSAGEWRERKSRLELFAHLHAHRPKKIGFHLPSWLSRFVSLSSVVAAFLRGQGDTAKLKIFMTQHKAEPWEEDGGEKLDWQAIKDRAEPYGPAVPRMAGVLTCGVDVQDDRIEAEVVAWGRKEESWSMETQVFWGSPAQPTVWREVDEFLKRRWTHASGVDLPIAAACVDTGGHYTKQAYEFVRRKFHRKVFAIKGASQAGKPLVGRPTKSNLGKIPLFPVGTDTAKETIYSRLTLVKPGPGYMHYPAAYDEEHYKQLTAEKLVITYKDGKGSREWKKIRQRNEALDLRVYAMAALALLNPNLDRIVRDLNPEDAETIEAPEPAEEVAEEAIEEKAPPRRRRGKKKGGWVNEWKR